MKYIYLTVASLFIFSCASILKSTVAPNQCKKCVIINRITNEILDSYEGCGGENVRLEEKAKERAFDLSRNGSLCDLNVVCESWRKEPEN
jgi:hypothetical protein